MKDLSAVSCRLLLPTRNFFLNKLARTVTCCYPTQQGGAQQSNALADTTWRHGVLVGGAKDGVSSARIEKKDHFALSFPSLSSLISSISIIALLFDKHCACTPVVTLKTTPTHNLK